MSPVLLLKRGFTNWQENLRRLSVAETIPEPSTDFTGYRYGSVFRRAWALFLGLSVGERFRVAGAFGLLMVLNYLSGQLSWESPWKDFGVWFLHLSVSTWLLGLLMLPRTQRAPWWVKLPRIVLYVFVVDAICQFLGVLLFLGSVLIGIFTGWVLPWLSIPPLFGKFSPDFLIIGPPLILVGVVGVFILRTLLGLSLVIPLMLDCNGGLMPSVRASLASTRNQRTRLLILFLLMAAIFGLVLMPISIAKYVILGIPWLLPTLLPASSAGVWLCFGLQTLAIVGGTFLVVWIWPLGTALWAALYLERWKPALRQSA